VVRFRRGVIVGIAAAGSLAVIGTAWVALKPAGPGLAPSGDERPAPAAKAAPDALAGAPRSYGEVPRLGPPLPGDLGQAILEHQREMATELPPDGPPETPAIDPARQAEEAERQRLAAEAVQARHSPVLMQLSGRSGPPPSGAPAPVMGEAPAAAGAAEPAQAAPGQGHNQAFINGRDQGRTVNPHRLEPAASPRQLDAGSVIAASLATGLNSDLPGMVVAQVT
jgi:type IV secretion system protein VirB10